MSPNCHLVHLGSTDLVPPELPVIRSTTSAKHHLTQLVDGVLCIKVEDIIYDANKLLLIEDVVFSNKVEEKEEMFVWFLLQVVPKRWRSTSPSR